MTDAQEYLDSAKAKYDSRDLHRATQALHDAATVYAVDKCAFNLDRLTRAAEDYAEAYLRG